MPRKHAYKGKVNENKLMCNQIRAKTIVREYAICNDFEYFITLTLDKEKYDRYNLQLYIKDLGQFIRDYRKKTECNVQYLFIPEQHIDGAWHIHGLIKGISQDDMKSFDDMENVPIRLKNKDFSTWLQYEKKFGYCSLGKIRDKERVSSYITKYIAKSIGKTDIKLNKKAYYCSRGLKKGVIIKKGELLTPLEYDKYKSNEYVDIVELRDISNIDII